VDIFISQQKNQLLDSLENQVRFSQLVAVIIGEKGIGKSFLLECLQKRLEDEVLIARVDASLAMSEDQLDKTISLQLGLSWQESDTPIEQRIKNDLSQKVLIAVDNAHLMSNSCLNFILQLNQNQLEFQESVLFVILAGESTLPKMINQTETFGHHQEMCVVFQIEPVVLSETQPLMEAFGHHNIDVIDGLYDEKKIDYFWQLSKGNPAELNYHLSRWLTENSPTKVVEVVQQESGSFFKSMLYVSIAVGLMAVLFFQEDINRWISTEQSSELIGEGQQSSSTASDIDNISSLSEKKTGSAKRKKHGQLAQKENGEDSNQAEQVITSKTKEIEVIESSKAVSASGKIALSETSAVKQVNPDKEQAVQSPQDNKEVEVAAEIKQSQINPLTSDEQNLLAQNGKYYALQWVGLSQLTAAQAFKDNHPARENMRIYRRTNGKNVFYLVISDYFASREIADKSKLDYQNRGIAGKPWVKSISAIQSEINQFAKAKN